MNKIFLAVVASLLLPGLASAANITYADKVSGGSFSAADANEIKTAVNSKANLAAITWVTATAYTANNQSVTHGGHVFVCTSNHTSGASTEPGTGADWATVWKYHGSDLYAAALGADDNYVTGAEKTRIGQLESTDTPVFAGVDLGVASTTTGLFKLYGNSKAYAFEIHSLGADAPSVGWRWPSTLPAVDSVAAIDTNGYWSYLPSTAIVASGFNGNLTTGDDTVQEVAQKLDDLSIPAAPSDTAYDATTWDSNTNAATKNAIRDKIEAISSGLTSLPTADNQILQATGSGTYAWTSTLDGIGNITGAGSYNKITVTQPATGATLTLVEGSTLATSGAYSLTLTTTGATNVTLPTTGTLLATGDVDDTPVDGVTTAPVSSNWAYDHEADTSTHGTSGAIVGTTDTQTLSGKSITAVEVDGSASGSLSAANVSSTIVYNTGMGAADVALVLPTAAAGYSAIFTVGTAQSNKWGVQAGTNDKIYLIAADGTVAAGSDAGYARMTAAQVGQSFACWTFKTDAYDWMCKSVSIGTSTFAAN